MMSVTMVSVLFLRPPDQLQSGKKKKHKDPPHFSLTNFKFHHLETCGSCWIEISDRERYFRTKNEYFKREWVFCACGNGFFKRAVECSRPSLKFVKEFLRFSLSQPRHLEDNYTKNHEEWPKQSLMAANRPLIGDYWRPTNSD